ncbi:MAG: hypothetical protein A2W22_00695 [Candidatus Levybacteria bacterium RBG_16_35_11]|nr:MAG: hypothetical protein A2W22_00695 [Candidatus Levybacteria bacterium RBG_16_35_11]
MSEKLMAIPQKDLNMAAVADELYFHKKGWVVLVGKNDTGVIEGDGELPVDYSGFQLFDGGAEFSPRSHIWITEGKHIRFVSHDLQLLEFEDYLEKIKRGEVKKARTTKAGMIFSSGNGGKPAFKEIALVPVPK